MSDVIKNAREIIQSYDGPKLRIMEVCGTHTHEIFKMGIRNLLPENIDLISGPGCPVCVTPVGFIDEAIYLALEKGCVITTFGDLIKVPGTKSSLAGARSEGADVRPVYSPDDAVELAKENPDMQVVFLAVGFETTTPSACLAVKKAQRLGLSNFSILTANKTMPSAYKKLAGSADAFLFPGHVNAIAPYLEKKLDELMAAHPDKIKAHRGLGLMRGLELADGFPVGQVTMQALKEGMLVISAGSNVLRFVPPLIITEKEVDEAVAILEKCFA